MKKFVLGVLLVMFIAVPPGECFSLKKLAKDTVLFPFRLVKGMFLEVENAIYVKRKMEMSKKPFTDFLIVEEVDN